MISVSRRANKAAGSNTPRSAPNSIAAVKALFKTGLFNDVYLERDGDVLVVYFEERAASSSSESEGHKDLETMDMHDGLKQNRLARWGCCGLSWDRHGAVDQRI